MPKYKIGNIEEFPVGRGVGKTVEGIDMAVFNMGNDDVRVSSNLCPHKRLKLHHAGNEELGKVRGDVDTDHGTIRCPWHNLEFDLETGENPVMNKCINIFEVEVNESGEVFVYL